MGRFYFHSAESLDDAEVERLEIIFSHEINEDTSRGVHYKLEFEATDFEKLAQAMMNADPTAATKAFGAALVRGQSKLVSNYLDDD